MKKKNLIIVVLSTLVVFLLICNVFLISQRKDSTSSDSTSFRQQVERGNSGGYIPPAQGTESTVITNVQIDENGVEEASEGFLQAYYSSSTSKTEEEYLAGFEGYVTQNGIRNMSDYLTFPRDPASRVKIERMLENCKVYISTKGERDASALCVSHVREVVTVDDEDPRMQGNPTLMRLELKLEDAVWKVNSISMERSLAGMQMDISELLN